MAQPCPRGKFDGAIRVSAFGPQSAGTFRNDDEKLEWLLRRLEDPTYPLPDTGELAWGGGLANRAKSLPEIAQTIADQLEREVAAGRTPEEQATRRDKTLVGMQLAQGSPLRRPALTGQLTQHPILSVIENRVWDSFGEGRFGAPRGGARVHLGQDLLAAPGEIARSPIDGTIVGIRPAYLASSIANRPALSPFKAMHIRGSDGREYVMRYVINTDQAGNAFVMQNDPVVAGQEIGLVQDRAGIERPRTYPMGNHVHFEIRDRVNGTHIDPRPLVNHWLNRQQY